MIDKTSENLARLYARGLLTGKARQEFEVRLQQDTALCELVARLSNPDGEPLTPLPRDEPSRVGSALALVSGRPAPIQEASTPAAGRFEEGGIPYWLPWVLAASLAVICVLLLTQGPLEDENLAQLRRQLDEAENQNSILRNDKLALQRTIDELKQKDRLSQVLVVSLYPAAPDLAKPTAVVVLDRASGQGLFVGMNLPSISNTQGFQLWGSDPDKQTASAGVFRADHQGRVRFDFAMPRFSPSRFFVTIERKDGSSQPLGPVALTSD
jgi:anti-sigma-K factor RskA